ncbi:MAG: ACT domain-containing protein [Chloroflexi bacterium]|nr:ACT domain-containing protein [Chloroflexota bacterium]
MNGETDLETLLQNMRPELNAGGYVFCTLASREQAAALDPLCLFQEREGVTVILPSEQADALGLAYTQAFAWITLTVHSSLEAVGLTAAFSRALTEAGISCNVAAAYYHDHIFVPIGDAERAMDALRALAA